MNSSSLLCRFAGVVLATLVFTASASAQDNTAAGSDDAAGSQALSTDVDTSAFEDLQRAGQVTENGAGAAAATGGFGGFGGGGFGGGLGGLFGAGQNGFNNNNQATTPSIRTRMRSAVRVAPMPQQRVQSNANQRFVKMSRRQGMSRVSVNVVGRTAVLRGAVGTQRDRRMSELLMRLEPGVTTVKNELVVTAPDGNAAGFAAPQNGTPSNPAASNPAPTNAGTSIQGNVIQGEVLPPPPAVISNPIQ